MLAVMWYHNIFAVLFAFLAIFLMLVILLQRGRGVGLAGAFGGAGGHSAFGAKTGDVLTWVTVILTVIFLFFAIIGNYTFVTPASTLGASRETGLIDPGAETTPAASPTPTPIQIPPPTTSSAPAGATPIAVPAPTSATAATPETPK